ncbi:hypothetical protein DSO57_1005205 [Entomophthora muscae]|uniref:Uncharacterized protein n=1 Tax=Entomophthora muscae TaxID=34485 RepID=A0ACC2T812_9FUNG|nr:hypothetical protein DSO57_1005205 [Entomophthora muscae]
MPIPVLNSKSEEPDHSPVYRNHATKDSGELFKTLPDGSHTLYHAVQTSIEKHGPNVCFGSRRIVDNLDEIKEVERKVDGEMIKEDLEILSALSMNGFPSTS